MTQTSTKENFTSMAAAKEEIVSMGISLRSSATDKQTNNLKLAIKQLERTTGTDLSNGNVISSIRAKSEFIYLGIGLLFAAAVMGMDVPNHSPHQTTDTADIVTTVQGSSTNYTSLAKANTFNR